MKDGLRTGKGKYEWPDGTKYDGEWKDNLKNGQGIFYWPVCKLY